MNKGDSAWQVSKYGVSSGRYFPVFELNMEIYGVSLRIQSEYSKIRTRKNSIFGHFSRSGNLNESIYSKSIWLLNIYLLHCYTLFVLISSAVYNFCKETKLIFKLMGSLTTDCNFLKAFRAVNQVHSLMTKLCWVHYILFVYYVKSFKN